MRAIAPHWEAQKASWGEAACLFESLTFPAIWLCQLAAIEGEGVQPLPEPVIQLLASSVATILKAARVTVLKPDFTLPYKFLSMIDKLPAAISLLLPRIAEGSNSPQGASSKLSYANRAMEAILVMSECSKPELCLLMVLGSCHATTLVTRTSAELLHCSEPGTTRRAAHLAVGDLSCYAAALSSEITYRASQGYERTPSGSAQLRDLLARPLLRLLHSPLLDTLVALQHVMVEESFPGLQRGWESSARKYIYPLNPRDPSSSTELDAMVVTLWSHDSTFWNYVCMAQLATPLIIPLAIKLLPYLLVSILLDLHWMRLQCILRNHTAVLAGPSAGHDTALAICLAIIFIHYRWHNWGGCRPSWLAGGCLGGQLQLPESQVP